MPYGFPAPCSSELAVGECSQPDQPKLVEVSHDFVVLGCDLQRTSSGKPRCVHRRLKIQQCKVVEVFGANLSAVSAAERAPLAATAPSPPENSFGPSRHDTYRSAGLIPSALNAHVGRSSYTPRQKIERLAILRVTPCTLHKTKQPRSALRCIPHKRASNDETSTINPLHP